MIVHAASRSVHWPESANTVQRGRQAVCRAAPCAAQSSDANRPRIARPQRHSTTVRSSWRQSTPLRMSSNDGPGSAAGVLTRKREAGVSPSASRHPRIGRPFQLKRGSLAKWCQVRTAPLQARLIRLTPLWLGSWASPRSPRAVAWDPAGLLVRSSCHECASNFINTVLSTAARASTRSVSCSCHCPHNAASTGSTDSSTSVISATVSRRTPHLMASRMACYSHGPKSCNRANHLAIVWSMFEFKSQTIWRLARG